MNILALFLAVSTVLALSKSLSTNLKHITKKYTNLPPILISTEYNPYLSLPQNSTKKKEGKYSIHIDVAPPIGTYVWEFSGFFDAAFTEEHLFSIEGADMAIIQLGWKHKHGDTFDTLVTSEFRILDDNPQHYDLKEDELYPVKITYTAGFENNVHVYVSGNNDKKELNKLIQHPSTDPKRSNMYEHAKKCLFSYSPMEGLFNDGISRDKLLSIRASHVLEIIGFVQFPSDSQYNIYLDQASNSVLQIGPGSKMMDLRYSVDSKWNILDTRKTVSQEFFFEHLLIYPFRIVVLANSTDQNWDITVKDQKGTEVDVFNLWDFDEFALELSGQPNIEKASANPFAFCDYEDVDSDSGPSRGDMSPEMFDPNWILEETDPVSFYELKALQSSTDDVEAGIVLEQVTNLADTESLKIGRDFSNTSGDHVFENSSLERAQGSFVPPKEKILKSSAPYQRFLNLSGIEINNTSPSKIETQFLAASSGLPRSETAPIEILNKTAGFESANTFKFSNWAVLSNMSTLNFTEARKGHLVRYPKFENISTKVLHEKNLGDSVQSVQNTGVHSKSNSSTNFTVKFRESLVKEEKNSVHFDLSGKLSNTSESDEPSSVKMEFGGSLNFLNLKIKKITKIPADIPLNAGTQEALEVCEKDEGLVSDEKVSTTNGNEIEKAQNEISSSFRKIQAYEITYKDSAPGVIPKVFLCFWFLALSLLV